VGPPPELADLHAEAPFLPAGLLSCVCICLQLLRLLLYHFAAAALIACTPCLLPVDVTGVRATSGDSGGRGSTVCRLCDSGAQAATQGPYPPSPSQPDLGCHSASLRQQALAN
jgi:hypothetical protein